MSYFTLNRCSHPFSVFQYCYLLRWWYGDTNPLSVCNSERHPFPVLPQHGKCWSILTVQLQYWTAVPICSWQAGTDSLAWAACCSSDQHISNSLYCSIPVCIKWHDSLRCPMNDVVKLKPCPDILCCQFQIYSSPKFQDPPAMCWFTSTGGATWRSV